MKDRNMESEDGLDDPLEGPPQEELHLVVADDDPAVVRLLGDFLTRLGYRYRTASDGVEAMEVMQQAPSAIIVTDLLMPKMDGMELIRRVKKEWPDTDIIVVTGYTRDFRYTDVIRAGASDFIQKPFNLDELEAKLDRIIRERRLRSLLQRMSVRDGLTDLYNRRFFEQRIDEEAERALRQAYPLFLVMLDVDGFKGFNDRLGHRAGDGLLCQLADVLRKSTRRHVDTPFRYGGDEFVIIIPQARAEQAEQIAERIRRCYREQHAGDSGDTSLSLGVARLTGDPRRDPGGLVDRLVHQADEAMYAAKRAGGNRVVLHESVSADTPKGEGAQHQVAH